MTWGPFSALSIVAVHCSAENVTLRGQDRINMGNKGIWQSLILDWDTSNVGYFLYTFTFEIALKKTGSHNISFRRVVFLVGNRIKCLLSLYFKYGSKNISFLKKL